MHIVVCFRGSSYPEGYFVQNLQFDFFNYAGIHRSVSLYTTPSVYIADVTVTTTEDSQDNSTWSLEYKVDIGGSPSSSSVSVSLYDASGKEVVGSSSGASGTIKVRNPSLWWPWTLNPSQNVTYRYRLQVSVVVVV